MAQSANSSSFQVHHFGTHLISGLMAKMAGTTLWAPMNRIQSMAGHPGMPLTLKEAYRLAKQVCRSEGLAGLWSGYRTSLSTLLPYTMLYFASYEQFKQMARWMVAEKAKDSDGNRSYLDAFQKYWSVLGQPGRVPVTSDLSPGTFMMCITGAIVLSSFVCQTATAIQSLTLDRYTQPASANSLDPERVLSLRRPLIPSMLQSFQLQPSLPFSTHSPTRIVPPSVLSIAGAAGFKYHPAVPSSHFKTLMSSTTTVASQALAGLPWQQSQQHATLTTTSHFPFRSSIAHQRHLASMPLKGHVHPGSALSFLPPSTYSLPTTTAATTTSNVGNLASYKPGHMMTMMTAPLQTNSNSNSNNAMNAPCSNDNEMTRKVSNSTTTRNHISNNGNNTPGLFRTIARGLGPRIMWTIPGVTLTTAGFEVLRSLAA
ncbi:hypothetical protein BGX33_003792 [Mortierella sp. NVP41]|nr:hypothetical protein BGX33_003792 [Mortierella sp. NVP41]